MFNAFWPFIRALVAKNTSYDKHDTIIKLLTGISKMVIMCDWFTFLFEWEYNQYEASCVRTFEDKGPTKYAVTFKPPNPFPQFGDQLHNLFTEPDGRFYCWGSSDKGCLYFRANLMRWLKKYLEEQERLQYK